MSTHVRCPICGYAAANITSPDKRWGQIYDGEEIDRAFEPSSGELLHNMAFRWDEGREIFECPCKRAVWIADRQIPGGSWFVNRTIDVLDGSDDPRDLVGSGMTIKIAQDDKNFDPSAIEGTAMLDEKDPHA
jgi:hypothetical protein